MSASNNTGIIGETVDGVMIPYVPKGVSGNLSIPPARPSSPMRSSVKPTGKTAPPKTATFLDTATAKEFNLNKPATHILTTNRTTIGHNPMTTNGNIKKRARPLPVSRPNIPVQPLGRSTYNSDAVAAPQSDSDYQSYPDYLNRLSIQMNKEIEEAKKIPGIASLEAIRNIAVKYGVLAELAQYKTGSGRKTRRSNRKSKRKTTRSHTRRTA